MSVTTTQPSARPVSDAGKLDVSGEPLDGRGAAWRESRARSVLGRVGGGRSGGVGALAAAHRRDRRRDRRDHRRAGRRVFLGPNVSVLQAAIATCIDFSGERNEVVYEALQFPSLTYVWREWERYGARVRVVVRRRAHDSDRTHRRRDHRKTAIAVLSHAYYVSGAVADIRAIQAHCRNVGALLCVDAYQTTGIYPYDVTAWDLDLVTGGSHKWLCGGPGCGWIYVKPSYSTLRPAVTGWMAHERPFAFEAAPIEHADDVPFRHGTPTIPGYVVAKPGHE